MYLFINASKYNLNDKLGQKNRANCLEFLVYFNKKFIFLKEKPTYILF